VKDEDKSQTEDWKPATAAHVSGVFAGPAVSQGAAGFIVSGGRAETLPMTEARCRMFAGAALTSLLCLAGCALEVQNVQPAQQMAQAAKPPGSVYTGWRVFQDKCAGCHGPAATGTAGGPDLLPRVREMGSRRFVNLVLLRYDWNLPAARAGSDSAAREALIDQVLQRQQGGLTMPAWQGEPRVSAHIADLYAYLGARAQGTQGPGRPTP
jgi:Cytochrome C oxidase, cbb3-type, subunit III